MAKLLKNEGGLEIVKKTINVSGPTGKNMGKVSDKASGSKSQKAPVTKTQAEIFREKVIQAGQTKSRIVNGRMYAVAGSGPEKLTAMPEMKQLPSQKEESGKKVESSKTKKTTTGGTIGTQTKTPKRNVENISKVATAFSIGGAPMAGKVETITLKETPKKQPVKEDYIATFGRGTHQDVFRLYPSQLSDFVSKNPKWKNIIDTSSPEAMRESFEKLPADFIKDPSKRKGNIYSEESKDALVRLLDKAYGGGKSLL